MTLSKDFRFTRRTVAKTFIAATVLTVGLFGCGGSDNNGSFLESKYYASWTGSMLDATQARAGTTPVVQVFNNQSIRHVLRLSLGGDAMRVKVSNLFGKAPITFSGVQVAKSTGGSGIDVSSSQVVTFNGQPSVTVAAGTELLSDPVTTPVTPLSNIAVTLYFASPTTLNTVHALGRQTAYIGAGNQLSSAAIPAPTSEQRQSYYGLTAVEASSASKTNIVVTFGDSITDGFNSTVDAAKRYPNQLDDRLKAAGLARTGVANAGISGNRWINDITGPNGNGRFDRDVLNVPGVTHTIILLGVNDIRNSFRFPAEAVTTDQLVTSMTTAVTKSKAKGVKVILGTILPCKGETFCPASVDSQRQVLNTWIRNNKDVDGVVDFDQVMQNPLDPAAMNPVYDSGDHLHPNDVGYGAMANAIDLAKLQ
ncbi:MAG: SGNH/GDSL hydrolase family protein [Polaromonas sp.]